MDPNHFPHSNRRNINSSWNVDDEDEDWSTEQQSTNDEEDYQDNEEEDYDDEEDEGFANRNSNTHFENRNSNTHFENRNSYQRENMINAEDYDDEEDEGFAEDMEDDDADDDEEDEEKYAKIDEEEEDDDGDDEGLDGPYAGWAQNIPSWQQGNTSWQQGSASWQQSNLGWPQGSIGWQKGNSSWQQQNGNAQDEHQRHIGAHQQHHLPIQSETSSGEEYRVNEQVGVGGDEGFGYPLEENPEQSDQEVLKTGDEESGYNENGVEEQGKAKDVETVVPKGTAKGAQKRKSLAAMGAAESVTKKSKKKSTKSTNVWSKGSSRKGGKKNKGGTSNGTVQTEDTVNITPVCRIPDKVDDTPDMKICLSKIYKAEKVELSEDRLTAGSTKGYRMVRANRGAVEGAWYFEIKVVHLGETGHTRLGWSTEKGDVQAPVGYDANSYSYRDVDGSKVHKAVREPYGDGPYVEGDVIGFYINLPNGSNYAPKPVEYVLFKGQLHYLNNAEEPPKIVPGSEISFFRNGKCQGVAFRDIIAGRYYPAASMYTLPNQSNCTVQFNFGPTFDCFPEDFGERPLPKPMYEAPYCGFDGRVVQQGECLVENGQTPEKRT